MTLVAVVDGNEVTRQRTCRALRSGDLEVVEASSGLEALRLVFTARPDAAVVDIRVDGVDGFQLISLLRAACEIPIIAAADCLSPDQIVRALGAGADDAVDKSCASVELVARARAAIRRHQRRASSEDDVKLVTTGGLVIDRVAQQAMKHGRRVPLTRTEYRLLDALSSRIGQVHSRRSLLATVWGEEYVDDTHYLRIYVGYLRAKVEDAPSRPRYVVNEWGTGYRLMLLPIEDRAVAEHSDVAAS